MGSGDPRPQSGGSPRSEAAGPGEPRGDSFPADPLPGKRDRFAQSIGSIGDSGRWRWCWRNVGR